MDPHKKADINLVVPDREIRVVRIDFELRLDLRIFRAIVRHGDNPEIVGLGAPENSVGNLAGLFRPLPENHRTREKSRNFGRCKLTRSGLDSFLLRRRDALDQGPTGLWGRNSHGNGSRGKDSFRSGKNFIGRHENSSLNHSITGFSLSKTN